MSARKRSSLDSQVGGNHYKKLGNYQPWQVMAKWLTPEELFGYMKGTVIAYLARNKENPREDAEKAMHVIQLYLELSKQQAESSQRQELTAQLNLNLPLKSEGNKNV